MFLGIYFGNQFLFFVLQNNRTLTEIYENGKYHEIFKAKAALSGLTSFISIILVTKYFKEYKLSFIVRKSSDTYEE